MKNLLVALVCALVLVPLASAQSASYVVTVKDNGQALVLLTINGTGLFEVPLQQDVVDIKVKGALYTVVNRTAAISIGSTHKAVVLYKTSAITSNQQGQWTFEMYLPDVHDSDITVNLPGEARIESTEPEALIEDADYKKLRWRGNMTGVRAQYTFADTAQSEPAAPSRTWLYIGLVAITGAGALLARFVPKRSHNRDNILKTLPKNEASVMSILVNNRGSIKRSQLERKSGIAKSSLAASLNNLEKKKIIDIDRSNTVHFIRTTKWFEEL